MEESEGAFGKRRRNVLIVGVITLALVIGRPNMEKFELFGLEFSFKGREWIIWLSLTIWMIYVVIRAVTYYSTHLKSGVIEQKIKFIHPEYILKILQQMVIDQMKQNQDIASKAPNYSGNQTLTDHTIVSILSNCKVPCKYLMEELHFHTDADYKQITQQVSYHINLSLNDKQLIDIKKNRIRYFFSDHWWEHSFMFIFITCVGFALVYQWIVICIKSSHLIIY